MDLNLSESVVTAQHEIHERSTMEVRSLAPAQWNLVESVVEIRSGPRCRSATLFVLPLRSICSRDDKKTCFATLQFMNSATTTIPLHTWCFICIFSAFMTLSWRPNYAHNDCRCATADYLLAFKTFHNSIPTFYSRCHPPKAEKNYNPRSGQETKDIGGYQS